MAVGADLDKAMATLQMGVGVSGGAQCVGHAVKAGIAAHPDHVTLQIDCKNAFYSSCWTSMLRAIATAATPTVASSGYMDVQRSKPAARAGGITHCHFIVVQTRGEAG